MVGVAQHMAKPDMRITSDRTDADTQDIIDVMMLRWPQAISQAKSVAHFFLADTPRQTAANIYNWLGGNIKYKKDPKDFQDIRVPSRFVNDKTGDCKSYSLFTAAVLYNLGMAPRIRFASYDVLDPTPTHVYVIGPDGTIIDAVWGRFDSEKPFQHKQDYIMEVRTLSGLPGGQLPGQGAFAYAPGQDAMVGGVKDWWQDRMAEAKIVAPKVKTGLFAPAREAYKLLLRINFKGWATDLQHADWPAFSKMWHEKFGGNRTKLKQAIEVGAKKKPFLGAVENGYSPNAVLYEETFFGRKPIGSLAATVGAAYAKALVIIKAVSEFLDKAVVIKEKIENAVKTGKDLISIKKKPGDPVFDNLPGQTGAGSGSGGIVVTSGGTATGSGPGQVILDKDASIFAEKVFKSPAFKTPDIVRTQPGGGGPFTPGGGTSTDQKGIQNLAIAALAAKLFGLF